MKYKCLNCDTEMIVHNQIKSDMIDNPYVGQIVFECPNCRLYRKTAFPIERIFKARDEIDAGKPVKGCNNFDDFLKKLEELSWNYHVEHWDKFTEAENI